MPGCGSKACARWTPRVNGSRKSLAAWRERRAIERNRPRGWILDDAALREIVMQVPRSAGSTCGNSGVPRGRA